MLQTRNDDQIFPSSRMTILREYPESLRTDLTPEEKIERGRKLAELVQKIDSAEAEERDRRKGVKEVLDALIEQRTSLAFIVHRGQEDRESEIEERADYETRKVSTVRLDTGEVVRERDLLPEERQEYIPGITDVLDKVAAQVNSGALDSQRVTVTAEVRRA